MKFITNCFVAIAFAANGFGAFAQNNALENQNGFEVSQRTGIISSLSKWNTFGGKTYSPILQPQDKLMAQMGVKQTLQKSTLAESYEFYGGEAYKGNNVPYDAVTDAAGNTYITGGSTNEGQPSGDFFTMKVSASGQTLWQKREAAAIYAVEYGMHVALDNTGNLIVSGLKWNGNDMDIRIIKYSPEGTKIWDSVFESGGNGIEIPAAMVLGTDGSIYITGITWSGNSVNYLTLKYNSDGTVAWSQAENPAGGETWNEATAIALDQSGNVLVTGFSPNADGWLNYHTIKYSPLGTKLWEQGYNYASTDPDNVADVTNSTAHAITSDADGNVYVSGTFDTFLGRIGTIKYTAGGEQQWVHTYKSGDDKTLGAHIAVQDETVYVCGLHVGGFSSDGTVLISYNEDGTENWIAESTDLIDAVNAKLLFDTEGNIIAAAKGMTPGVEEWSQDVAARAHKYSPDGSELGQSAFVIVTTEGTATMGDMAGTGVDSAGNIYFTVNSYYTENGAVFETVKSAFGSAPPAPEWNEAYANLGSPAASMLNSFAGSDGNTFSTGSYYTYANGMLNANYFLVKHTANGNIAWSNVYNAENGSAAEGIIGRADAQGNSYVCLVPGFEEYPPVVRVKKLSPQGTELWTAEVALFSPQLYVLEPQADGSVYLGGTAFETEDSEHASFVGIKLNADGTQAWKTYIDGTNAQNNIYQVNAGKVSAAGQLILTGAHGSGSFMSQDVNLTAVQFNADGTSGWMTPVMAEGASTSGTDLYIAPDGSIYINGFAQDNTTYLEDIITTKLSATGEVQWVNTFGDESRNERSYTLKPFSSGDIAVIGYSLAENGDIHNALIKYSAAGEELWDFSSENMRYYNDFHIDADDVCYIMDQAITDPFPHKIFTAPFPIATLITVDANGQNADEQFFVGPEYAEFYGERLIPHADGRLLLAGTVGNQSFYEGTYFFETEHNGTLGIPGSESGATPKNILGQNYPNPVHDLTTIPFYLTQGGSAVLTLYTTQGRLVQEIARGNFAVGNNTVEFNTKGLAPGIYFYQIACGTFKQARKMIIR